MTDSWLLEELAGKIAAADAAKKQEVLPSPARHPPYVEVLVGALDEALKVVGRSGADAVDAVLSGRYGLHKEDLAYNPGAYMSAMKDILDAGCDVLQKLMLEEIRQKTGVVAFSMEEAVFRVRGYFGETEPGRRFGLRVEYLGDEGDG